MRGVWADTYYAHFFWTTTKGEMVDENHRHTVSTMNTEKSIIFEALDRLYFETQASDPLRDFEHVDENKDPHWTLFIIKVKIFLHKAANTDLCAAVFSVALGFLIATPRKEKTTAVELLRYSCGEFSILCLGNIQK